ncbi:SLC13 family permease [Legionella spiritensis]|uniref:SLC13 family permease n=1 Tax=Legionella spiritensis TaxID=452 RepID=UPI000F701633|nr:SLC13 family permease [Legionella spiritensis]VEG92493.1 putative citrate transporter [Legionella spiritensis]
MLDGIGLHFKILVTTILLVWSVISFIREKIPAYLTALITMAALLALGVISTREVLAVFSNNAPVTIAAMFIIGASLQMTGVLDLMVDYIIQFAEKSFSLAMIVFFAFVLIASAFMNNTPIVIILTPVVIKLARKFNKYPSKFLIPLSYIAIMGGTCTLIGTSTNLLINGIVNDTNVPAFNIFDITFPGLIMAVAGIIFLLTAGRYLLPIRPLFTDEVLASGYGEKQFFAFGMVLPDSPFIEKTLSDVISIQAPSVFVIDIIRNEISLSEGLNKDAANSNKHKKKSLRLDHLLRNTKLKPYDRVMFRASKEELLAISKLQGITFGEHQKYLQFKDIPESIVLEGIVGPGSKLINNMISSSWIQRRYHCHIWAIHRRGQVIEYDFQKSPLKFGDVLLIEGTPSDLSYFFGQEDILSFTQFQKRPFSKKGFISIATIIGVVALSALNIMPISGLAIIGAVIVIATNCITARNAYESIDWRILMLIFGMLSLSTALEKTGIAAFLIQNIATYSQQYGPVAILASIYLITSFVTEFMTNNAAAVLITPLVIGLTMKLGLNPHPFIVAIMFAASASFATPLGYQTNTYVYNAGNYRFKDFLKVGIPLNIINFVTAILVIPIFWPLQ